MIIVINQLICSKKWRDSIPLHPRPLHPLFIRHYYVIMSLQLQVSQSIKKFIGPLCTRKHITFYRPTTVYHCLID